MKLKNENVSKKLGRTSSSIVLNVVASVVALIGIALLVNNILLFKNTVTQYVAQGYTADTVTKELLKSQLLPGIFEPVAVYGGIAFVLFGVGIVNKKVSKCLILLTKAKVFKDNQISDDIIEESIVEQNILEENIVEENIVDVENPEIAQQPQKLEEVEKG